MPFEKTDKPAVQIRSKVYTAEWHVDALVKAARTLFPYREDREEFWAALKSGDEPILFGYVYADERGWVPFDDNNQGWRKTAHIKSAQENA